MNSLSEIVSKILEGIEAQKSGVLLDPEFCAKVIASVPNEKLVELSALSNAQAEKVRKTVWKKTERNQGTYKIYLSPGEVEQLLRIGASWGLSRPDDIIGVLVQVVLSRMRLF